MCIDSSQAALSRILRATIELATILTIKNNRNGVCAIPAT